MLIHEIPWTQFKSFIIAKGLNISYYEYNSTYWLYAQDGALGFFCKLYQDSGTDVTDFETNYKNLTTTNLPLTQLDTDGAQIIRPKAAKKGWSYWAIPVEFTTSTLGGSLHCKTSDGVDIPWVSAKIYNGSDNEITTAGVLNANLNTCVKTVVDFEPTFNFEIIGGSLRVNSNPSSDVRLWIVAAPDIPAEYGGSKEFASGINVKFLSADNTLEVDGRVTKVLTYNAQDHRGKMRMILKHPAGTQVSFMIIIEIYRQ